MSRIGKKPVAIPSGVTADVNQNTIKVKGPKGELSLTLHPKVSIDKNESGVVVSVKNDSNKFEKALWGLHRSLINNMVKGVTDGYSKVLEINGVGYKAA